MLTAPKIILYKGLGFVVEPKHLSIIRRRRGDYRGIFTEPEANNRGITEPEANNCFSIFTQVLCVIWY